MILLLGVQRPPALPSLAETPDPAPSGALAWTAWSSGETCLYVARPSGEVVRPWCDRRGGEVAGWDGGHVLVRPWDGGDRLVRVDPTTGDAVSTERDRQRPAGRTTPSGPNATTAGSSAPRLWADDVPAWRQLHWQEAPTAD